MGNLEKVTDTASGELKRWGTANGKPIAVRQYGSLVLTKLGKQLGYRVKGQRVEC